MGAGTSIVMIILMLFLYTVFWCDGIVKSLRKLELYEPVRKILADKQEKMVSI